MAHKKTILIFGISSFLGSNLAEELKSKYRIVGTYYKNRIEIEDILTLKCDINNKDQVQKLVFLFKPDITLYCAGLTSLVDCHEFPKLADALNTAGVFNVSQASERYNSKFVYFSSSYIFQGENVLYKESDSPTPLTVYGNSVASAEFYIQKSCLNYLIFRTCPLFGRSFHKDHLSFLEKLEYASFKHEKIPCDGSVFTGFLDVAEVAKVFDHAIEKKEVNRLFQLSSKDILSHYDFAEIYFSLLKKNPKLVKEDWNFPIIESHLARQNSVEFYFQMDHSVTENILGIKTLSVRESLNLYLNRIAGNDAQKANLRLI